MRIDLPFDTHLVATIRPAVRPKRSSKRVPRDAADVLRALIIEDDAVIGIMLAELLEGMGYECAIESSEADAIAAAGRCRPNLMIVDVKLSEGSGISAVEQILSSGPLPHVFITGDPSRVHARRVGAVVVQKPFRAPALTSAIEEVLGAAVVN